jgi:pyrroloquinoline quinone (PQQ) biosynthesis protein C
MTKEEIKERISLLSDEMDANDEENRMMQREIDKLYSMLDKMHELENE